jgi:hypothetical protein
VNGVTIIQPSFGLEQGGIGGGVVEDVPNGDIGKRFRDV